MFNKDNRGRDERPSMPPAPPVQSSGNSAKRGMFSVLGPDVVVTGNVTATADLHIDGRVEGDVNCGSLAQGAESQIFGSVTADMARLAGAIEGTVRVKTLTVERSAKITGDVEYENITIENGGHIDGRLKHMSNVETRPAASSSFGHSAPAAAPVVSPVPAANEEAA
ncbi:MAG: polymer-forming cytoskeletal protein [Novosphingobium sp.]|nr:polymer-forming cytoskeletal protein [Novosphingobium sp.]